MDVVVGRETIVVSLSMASADVALAARDRDVDSRGALTSLAREAIRLSLDGEALAPVNEEASVDTSGGRIQMNFRVRTSNDRTARLIVTSNVPKRLARGHREL